MRKSWNKWLVFIVAALLVVGVGSFIIMKEKGPEVGYKKIRVKRGDIIQIVQSTGTVSPQNRLEIKPPIAGRIDEVLAKEGEVVKKGKVLAWISSTERAALMDSVRTQGEQEIKKWEVLYRPTPVIAPINGTIILRNVEAGQSFTNTDPIFVMADRLTVKAQVDETDIALIKLNQRTKIVVDAYPNSPIDGRVVHLAYDATVTNNVTTYAVDILPVDPPDFMRSGMTSNVNVEVAREENVLKLPMSALIQDDEGTIVLVPNGDKQRAVSVELGADDGKFVEVVSGLAENDQVLIKELVSKSKKTSSGSSPFFGGGGRRGRR